jgi:hypothetical protein
MQSQATTQNKSYLGTIGWLLFLAGIALLINSLANVFFYAPAFIASFVIGIILIAQDKTGSGVGLLLLTLIVPPIMWFGLLAYNVSDALETHAEQQELELTSMKEDIAFESIQVRSDGDYMICEGKVRNTGTNTYDFVKVKVEWLDSRNEIIDTDWTYAVGGESLAPREAKSFKIMTDRDRSMASARYYIIE